MRAVWILATASAALLVEPASAQTRGGFEVGPTLADYSYREEIDGETIARDDGLMYGLTVGYTETLSSGWFLRLQAQGLSGDLDYEDDDGERLENVSQTTGRAEFHLGRDFAVGRGRLTPFVGIGHRSLEDESGGRVTQGGLEGYNRDVEYRFVPVGVDAALPIGGSTQLLVSAQVNFLAGGSATSRFSDVDPDFPDLKLKLRGGHGLRFSALVQVPLGRSAVRFGPVFETWKVERSQSETFSDGGESLEFFEPANRTTMFGGMVSFAF